MSAQPKVTNEEMLNHIINFINANRYSPSLSELCEMSGIKSKATIHNRLYRMRNEGLIDYKALKGVSARLLMKKYGDDLKDKLWGGHLWNPSYFIATVSENTEEQIRAYIQKQKEK